MSNADWELVVRVRLSNACDHHSDDPILLELDKKELREAIKDEGGIYQVLLGWCDDEDFELISLEPIKP